MAHTTIRISSERRDALRNFGREHADWIRGLCGKEKYEGISQDDVLEALLTLARESLE